MRTMMGKIKKRAAALAEAAAGADAVVAGASAAPGVATEAAPGLPAGRAFTAEAVVLA